MADPISVVGLIGSVVGIAEVGLKLSHALYEYHGKFKSADQSAESIAQEVKNTTVVLKQMSANLERECVFQGIVKSRRSPTLFIANSVT